MMNNKMKLEILLKKGYCRKFINGTSIYRILYFRVYNLVVLLSAGHTKFVKGLRSVGINLKIYKISLIIIACTILHNMLHVEHVRNYYAYSLI